MARTGPGRLSISDIIERFGAEDEKTPASDQEPIEILADLIVVSNGTILFEDRAVTPLRAFDITDLTINLRDISTKRDTGRGTGTVAFVLNGTPMAITAEAIRVRPAHVKAQLNIVDLDLDIIWPYLPPDLPVHPDWGRFSTHVALLYDAADGFRTDADLKVADLTFSQAGNEDPLASLPDFVVNVRELVVKGDTVTAARLALATDVSIVDPTLSPPKPYEIRDVRLALENVTYPQGPPANVTLTMNLPAGATLDVRGTAAAEPLAANLTVTLGSVDLSLINPYISPVSPITIARGQLGATLNVAVTEGPSVRVNGEIVHVRPATPRPSRALREPSQGAHHHHRPHMAGGTVRPGTADHGWSCHHCGHERLASPARGVHNAHLAGRRRHLARPAPRAREIRDGRGGQRPRGRGGNIQSRHHRRRHPGAVRGRRRDAGRALHPGDVSRWRSPVDASPPP